MEFWGVEVKSGEPVLAEPGDDTVIHLSQACLGEFKKDKGSESVTLYVKVDDQKLVLGRLSGEKTPQISFDLVFEKGFELSHNWKHGSVYFCGYKSSMKEQSDDDSDLEEYPSQDELPLAVTSAAEKPESQAKPVAKKATASKPGSSASKQKVKIVEPKKEDETSTDDDDDDSDDDDSDAHADAVVSQVMTNNIAIAMAMNDDDDDSEDEDESGDDESSDEDVEIPKKKAEQSKKRPLESPVKTPAPEKKAKFVTPQKTDGKKGVVHVATPHPSKHAGKASSSNEPAKQQSPSSSGGIACKTCNRSFKTDQALQAHSKAKHSAGA